MRHREAADLAGSVALGVWAAFGVLAAVAVGGRGAPLELDRDLLEWSLDHRPATALALARAVTATGTGVLPYALVVVAALVTGRTARQRLGAALFGVVCLGTGQALRYGVMELARRPRPPYEDWATQASGWAFPSGHSTTAALTAGLLLVAVSLRAPRGKAVLWLLIGCWGAAVGLSRAYLGVHWFTDVAGGWLFAAGWLGVFLWVAARWLPGLFLAGGEPRPSTGEGSCGPRS
ncbi:phosphatase PAP2 family protein [Streptomyces griseoluteus]|uniref:Phosphatase PAP2 family protein n=1 Tax=Streptomyces griseoluteus TaxID=29306 RepID=A0A4Z1DMM4_STRGP|nr:phosphatase PAP2 family protein [Streptomyces griseoluteus]TGN84517.1 phosphatase PAP2 family protein [Streptomyces griseoluteus]GHE99196.1 phosphatase PAP2 family protein [Streptomyces griseoluteus]